MRLLRFRDGTWGTFIKGSLVRNDSLPISTSRLGSEGVHHQEIKVAIEEMEKNGHNCAEFGVLRSFIFSSKVYLEEL